ncbi:hypothetical protein MAPG_04112 [Magnaporthiopsis poae ATCC 64411]|uniref:Uncharacterized protein n=1 Tax=Magnaporthiopsis poae (strain ATCC 64411 / 73-15) TaxID=644358 RepID=A0A0C4DVU9_MAGP6|nr:hypothetical protein MAPG_04112 [Magnaporthiopsis poae ATCC 64411]
MPPRRKATPTSGNSSRAAPQSILKKRAAEYRKLLDDKLAQINNEYQAQANEVKRRSKDKIREKKSRIYGDRARERDQICAKLLKLLDARDAKLQAIAGKLKEMKGEYDTFTACLSAVYKSLSDKASNLPGISPGSGARTARGPRR